MADTIRVPMERLEQYFDVFTKHFLRNETTNVADVEVMSIEWGDQHVVEAGRLMGIAYDPRTNAVEIALESADHRVFHPKEIWVEEESDGFVRSIELVREDRSTDLVRVKRLGVRAAPDRSAGR